MKKNSLLFGLVLFIVGFLMLISPKGCLKSVVVILGVVCVANGIYQLLYTRKLFPDSTFQYSVLARGMLSIVVGLLAFFLPLKFAEMVITVMLYVLAIYLLVGAALLGYASGKLRDSDVDRKPLIREIVVSVLLAMIMLLIPAEVGEAIIRFGGLAAMLSGVFFIVYYIKNKPLVQEAVQVMDDISGDLTNS